MRDNEDGIFAMLKREPEQAAFLLKAGLGAPIVIVVWDWVASLFVTNLIVSPISLLLILLYAVGIAYLVGRLVRTADRWQVDSAMQARRLLTGNRRPEVSPAAPGDTIAIVAPPLPAVSFHQVYFFLRLNEEVLRARREGYDMSVVAIDVTVPGQDLSPNLMEKVSFEIAHIANNQAKTISQPLCVGQTEFVFSLAHLDRAGAKLFVSELVQSLGQYWCHYGIAVYPGDATNAESLVNYARRLVEESRQDQGHRPKAPAIA